MSDEETPVGKWRLTLAVIEPGNTATIPVISLGVLGLTEPTVFERTEGLEFGYRDGRRDFWPWSSLLHAEYIPDEGVPS